MVTAQAGGGTHLMKKPPLENSGGSTYRFRRPCRRAGPAYVFARDNAARGACRQRLRFDP